MKQQNKSEPIFNLMKAPDSVIIRHLRTELGKEQSYIQELEDRLEKVEKELKEKNQIIESFKVLTPEEKEKFKHDTIIRDLRLQVKELSQLKNKYKQESEAWMVRHTELKIRYGTGGLSK